MPSFRLSVSMRHSSYGLRSKDTTSVAKQIQVETTTGLFVARHGSPSRHQTGCSVFASTRDGKNSFFYCAEIIELK